MILMRLVLAVACSASPISAGGDDPGQPAPGARAAYEALLKEFPDRPGAYINQNADRGRTAAAKFLAFARQHREGPEAVEALGWVATHCLYSPEAAEAMRRIAEDHPASPHLVGLIAELERMYGDPFPAKEEMLRAAAKARSPREVRGAARLGLARELALKVKKVRRDRDQHALFLADGNVPFVAKPTATDADLARWSGEAASLCEAITQDEGYPEWLRSDAEAMLRSIREPGAERSPAK